MPRRGLPGASRSLKGFWSHNPISPYNAALAKNMDIAKDINHHPTPAGPAGRHNAPPIVSLGIWKFARNPEGAKEFLQSRLGGLSVL